MNVHEILPKHCLHCILCNSSMSRAISCAFVLPRIARMQLISRVEIALPQNPRLGHDMPTKDVGVHAASYKVDCERMRHLSSVLCRRRQSRQGIRKGNWILMSVVLQVVQLQRLHFTHWLTAYCSPPYISQPANPRMQYHFNMNMPHCSPLGVRWQPGRPQRPVRRPLRGAA